MRNTCFMSPEVFSGVGQLSFIHDWYTMSVVLGTQPHVLSYIKANRAEHTRRIVFKKKRVVFKSSPQLKDVQSRIKLALEPVCELLEDKDHILAYRKGVNPRDILREQAVNANCLIHFDIKGYFDNIRRRHVKETLVRNAGMCHGGANLMAFYAVESGTLQQGSECSPVISNLVGYDLIDKPIKEMLRGLPAEVDARYFRYCDNIFLFIHGDEPEGFYAEYKAFVTETLGKSRLRAHKWARVSKNNPKRAMTCLGMNCHDTLRIDRLRYDVMRAEFFNLSVAEDIADMMFTYAEAYGVPGARRLPFMVVRNKVLGVLRGKMQYVLDVNEKQGTALNKLYKAIALRTNTETPITGMNEALFYEIKKYRQHGEIPDDYISRVMAVA